LNGAAAAQGDPGAEEKQQLPGERIKIWRRAAATALINFFELRWLRISGACPEAELTFGAHPRIR
jgi:hypothetical protein